jgi:uncharacterized protein
MTDPERKAVVFLVLAGAILWTPLVHVLLGGGPGFLGDLGFRSGPRGNPLAWILGMVVAVLYAGYSVRKIPAVREHWKAISVLKLIAVVAAVGAAVVEEAVFRRLVMDAVMRAGGSIPLQVLVSALVFGLAHGVWGLVTGQWAVGLGVVAATGFLGGALAVVYVVGGRSLAPVIVSHFFITATIQPGIMFAMFRGEVRGGRRPIQPVG